MNKQEQVIQLLQKISELPEGEIKESMSKSLFESLTLKESIEFSVVFTKLDASIKSDSGVPDISEDEVGFMDLLFQVYEFLGVDLNIVVKDVPSGLKEKMEKAEPLMKELGRLVSKLKKIYS